MYTDIHVYSYTHSHNTHTYLTQLSQVELTFSHRYAKSVLKTIWFSFTILTKIPTNRQESILTCVLEVYHDIYKGVIAYIKKDKAKTKLKNFYVTKISILFY